MCHVEECTSDAAASHHDQLNMKLLSSAAYHTLHSSGFVKLLSERTLRDYTHFFQSKSGFQVEVEQMLMKEIRVDTMSA